MPQSSPVSPPAPLTVLFLWHMHQPYYVIPGQKRALLPWTRLHALKDYVDMPRVLAEFPSVQATFNLVPSLLWQLQQYASSDLTDIDLELSRKPAVDLTKEERIYLLRNFFSLDWNRILPRFPRLAQLLKKRGRSLYRERLPKLAEEFTAQELVDLQVLFNLGWSGNILLESKPLRALLRKERGFTEEDKNLLLDFQAEFLASVLPTYRQLAASGQAEISASPLYHPILPLLISTDMGRVSDSRTPVPERRFQYPQDAEAQITEAVRVMKTQFGFTCAGMWPSEGSVADEVVPLWHKAGIRWVASDEQVLWNSMTPSGMQATHRNQLYTPYRLSQDGASVDIFFRDRELSDLIGFTYSWWKPERAAQDFIGRIEGIRDGLRDSQPGVVCVILDGENAWEHYEENGRPFLRELYGRLAALPGVATSTFSGWLDSGVEPPPLPHLHPGSWIYGNFATWVGHPEKNRGWEELARARQELADAEKVAFATGANLPAAYDAVYRAEGSDWFWWYGDDHASEYKEEFDQLFRANLKEIYRALGKPSPDSLEKSLRLPAPIRPANLPTGLLHPVIDGRISHFFEWRGAGSFQIRGGGAMHQGVSILDSVYFAYDLERLFLLVHFHETAPLQTGEKQLSIWIRGSVSVCVNLGFDPQSGQFQLVPRDLPSKEDVLAGQGDLELAYGQVLEMALPISLVGLSEGSRLEISVEIIENQQVLERWPQLGGWEFSYTPLELSQSSWYI